LGGIQKEVATLLRQGIFRLSGAFQRSLPPARSADTPAETDPSGADFFCFQKRVVRDAELFELHETPDAGRPEEAKSAKVKQPKTTGDKNAVEMI